MMTWEWDYLKHTTHDDMGMRLFNIDGHSDVPKNGCSYKHLIMEVTRSNQYIDTNWLLLMILTDWCCIELLPENWDDWTTGSVTSLLVVHPICWTNLYIYIYVYMHIYIHILYIYIYIYMYIYIHILYIYIYIYIYVYIYIYIYIYIRHGTST